MSSFTIKASVAITEEVIRTLFKVPNFSFRKIKILVWEFGWVVIVC